jgi:hypothetical protein
LPWRDNDIILLCDEMVVRLCDHVVEFGDLVANTRQMELVLCLGERHGGSFYPERRKMHGHSEHLLINCLELPSTLIFVDLQLVHTISVHLPSQSNTSQLYTTSACHWSRPLNYRFHLKFKLYCERRSVGQFVLGVVSLLERVTRCYISLSDSFFLFFHVGTLTRGRVGRVNCCRSSPAQSFLVPSPAGLVTAFYCLAYDSCSRNGLT